MSGIQEKVVAITGASSDIGEAAARLLAGRGAKVMLGALRISPLYALAHEIVEAGGSAHYQALDVTQPKSIQCFIDEATQVFGRVDVIVNNAGALPLSILEGLEVCADTRVTVISPGLTEAELADGTAPDAIARAIALAIERPADVDTSEIIVRPTASPH